MSTSTERMRRKRQRDAYRQTIIAGAIQASQEKHESVTQRDERIRRALAHQEWLQTQESPHDSTEEGIKAHYGYSASETRTAAERNAAAQRMVSKTTASTGLPAVR